MTYSTALFDAATVQRMAVQLEVLLGAVATAADRALSDLRSMTASERASLEQRWRAGPAAPPASRGLVPRWLEQVERVGERVALIDGSTRFTYAELDLRCRRWVSALRAAGVKPGDFVGLIANRSADEATGLLAILFAGAAFLPLDPDAPPARSAEMCADAGAKIVVGQLDADLRSVRVVSPVHLDEHARVAAAIDERDLTCSSYLLFTSGSTGRPKGVRVADANLVAYLDGLADVIPPVTVGGPLRIALNAPLTFDASTKQWLQLFAGHTLVRIGRFERLDPAAFVERCRRDRVQMVDATPSHVRHLLDAGLEQVPTLERVVVGGEAIDDALWQRLADSHIRYFNGYGPTECTGAAAMLRSRDGARRWEARCRMWLPMCWTLDFVPHRSACRQSSTSAGIACRSGTSVVRD